MENDQNKSRKSVKVIANIVVIILAVSALLLAICPIFGIHIFTLGTGGKSVDRVDCIEGYYVVVYGNDICYYRKDGDDYLTFGNSDDITDFDWKHRETDNVVPYRRFLCFSKEAEKETYYLTDEAGMVKYGMMYVLRTSGDTVHYYYRRVNFDSRLEFPSILYKENITFSYNGETYDLENYGFFTSDVDFTTGEHILMIEGVPCYFKTYANV